MRDGSTRRRPTSPAYPARASERVQMHDWRRRGRLDALRVLTKGASGLKWSDRLLHVMLEELHVGDDFDMLVGRGARPPARQVPRLLAIALLLRHSWCPQDLARTAAQLGLLGPNSRQAVAGHSGSRTQRDRGYRGRVATGVPLPASRARYH